ncbi:hypothetical protein ACFYOD_06615 [Streptomyces sp. NPDC006703]|uniref:hypothetical protein n=1 Tax=Streptomyces sp. NPDC006703 TaxID=3364759 RepID=UPI00369DF9E8
MKPKLVDPCPPDSAQVCWATRRLARAVLLRLRAAAFAIEPRIKTIVATSDGLVEYRLWRLHGDDGRLLLEFDLLREPGTEWKSLTRDVCFLARLADLRTHPPGYFCVHPLSDSRDIAIPLPSNPRGLTPRAIGPLL